MAKIAVIKTGAKQYKVAVGDQIKVEKLEAEKGTKVKLDTLLIASGADLELGQPSFR
jgi:large subunit ribosomal protein L21